MLKKNRFERFYKIILTISRAVKTKCLQKWIKSHFKEGNESLWKILYNYFPVETKFITELNFWDFLITPFL